MALAVITTCSQFSQSQHLPCAQVRNVKQPKNSLHTSVSMYVQHGALTAQHCSEAGCMAHITYMHKCMSHTCTLLHVTCQSRHLHGHDACAHKLAVGACAVVDQPQQDHAQQEEGHHNHPQPPLHAAATVVVELGRQAKDKVDRLCTVVPRASAQTRAHATPSGPLRDQARHAVHNQGTTVLNNMHCHVNEVLLDAFHKPV